MKLIIDIDEKIYKESKKECEENDSLIIDTFTYAIGNGIPLEEELEKIKAEIKDLDLGFVDEEYQAGVAYGIMKFNKILNSHIAELK